jgi:NTE family protein
MDTSPTSPQHHTTRALVLGGGGSSGNAWSIGVLAGLLECGSDVTTADLVVGTSAGSTTAVQVMITNPADLLADILAAPPPSSTTATRSARPVSRRLVTDQLAATGAVIAAAHDVEDMRRRLGAAALDKALTDGSRQHQWRATVAARLPSPTWPQQRLLITAVDAETGEPALFDRDSGVDLADAVAASCSSGFAYRIGDRHYIDGGYRSNADNADLAAGYDRVLVLSPFGGRSRTPVEWGLHLETQVDDLRAHGSQVVTVFPRSEAEDLFGLNAMNYSLRPAAARAGRDHARVISEQVADLWS